MLLDQLCNYKIIRKQNKGYIYNHGGEEGGL